MFLMLSSLILILVAWFLLFGVRVFRYPSLSSVLIVLLRVLYNRDLLDRFRKQFVWSETLPFRSFVSNHAHPVAANLRCQATTTMQKFADVLGVRRYDVSSSTRESNKNWNLKSVRDVYDFKDLSYDYHFDKIQPNDLVTLVDVDYYLSDFSQYEGHPILIYTNIPDALVVRDGESIVYYDSPSTIVERISGGACYKSKIWDYSPDLVIIKSLFSFTVYAVEKVKQPKTKTRYMVYLCPKVTIRVPHFIFCWGAWVLGIKNNIDLLDHPKNVSLSNGLLIGRYYKDNVSNLSFKNETSDYCVNIPEYFWDNLVIRNEKSKTFMISDIEHECSLNELKLKTCDYSILAKALLLKIRPKYLVNFQAFGMPNQRDVHCEIKKPCCEILAEPIVSVVACSAAKTQNNDELCVVDRVENLRNTKVPKKIYDKYRTEFLGLLIGDCKGKGSPVDLQQVLDNQNLPVQRQRQENVSFKSRRRNRIKAFVKDELSDKIAPNHNISSMEQSHTLGLSCYAYAFKNQVLKRHKFYMPGSKPKEIIQRVRKYCINNKGKELVETDFSRFDASMSYWLRDLEFQAYKLWVKQEHLRDLQSYLSQEIDLKAKTKFGRKYEQASSRASGSPLTTEGNTIVNAYCAYAAYRLAGLSIGQSYNNIGPKYGDDGIDISLGKFDQMSEDLGLTLKIAKPGRNVTFLGRRYLDVYNSDVTFSDPIKILKRAPLSTNVGKVNALSDKINGYLVTDSHLPLVGEYLKALKRVYMLGETLLLDVKTQQDRDVHFRLQMGPWIDVMTDNEFMRLCEYEASLLKLSPSEYCFIVESLRSAKQPTDLDDLKVTLEPIKAPSFQHIMF